MKKLLGIGMSIFLSSVCSGSDYFVGAGSSLPEYVVCVQEVNWEVLSELHSQYLALANTDDVGANKCSARSVLDAIEAIIGDNERGHFKHCWWLLLQNFRGNHWKVYVARKALEYELIAQCMVRKEREEGMPQNGVFLDEVLYQLGQKWMSVIGDCLSLLKERHSFWKKELAQLDALRAELGWERFEGIPGNVRSYESAYSRAATISFYINSLEGAIEDAAAAVSGK